MKQNFSFLLRDAFDEPVAPSTNIIIPQSIYDASISQYSLNRTDRTGEEQDLVGFELLNQYTLLNTLGHGASATVLLAVDFETGQMYAVKRIMKKILKRGYFALSGGCIDYPLLKEHCVPQKTEDGEKKKVSFIDTARESSNNNPFMVVQVEGSFLTDVQAGTTGPGKKKRGDTRATLPEVVPDYCIENEIAILKRIRHPNIVRLHEVIEEREEDLIYLVMDYAERGPIVKMETGEDGQQRCTPITPVSKVREYSLQIANALLYLHKRKILHRDIKPDNILIDKDGRVKICDFGISYINRHDDEATSLTTRGMKGTPAFLSPEVCSGQLFTTKSDVWSLGVTIYVMLFGVLPFNGHSTAEVMSSIVTRTLEFPTDISCSHPFWQKVLRSLLAKDPTKRMTLEQFLVCDAMTESSLSPSPPTATNTNRIVHNVSLSVTATDDSMDLDIAVVETFRCSPFPPLLEQLPQLNFFDFSRNSGVASPINSGTTVSSNLSRSLMQERSSLRVANNSLQHSQRTLELLETSGFRWVFGRESSSKRRQLEETAIWVSSTAPKGGE